MIDTNISKKRAKEFQSLRAKLSINSAIKTIAAAYTFDCYFCNISNKWFVRAEEHNCVLFWASDEGTDQFFISLKKYFEEIGFEKNSTYSS